MLRPKRKIVVSVHGIESQGVWQKELAPLISEQGWIYYPLHYGIFRAWKFALPPVRRRKVDWFRGEYNAIQQRFPGIQPSIIAHSYGTYIVTKALYDYPALRADKIILCGSIAPLNYDWGGIFERKQATAVRNDFGCKDFWSRHVRWLARDTGPSGYKGFDVTHDRLRQSGFGSYHHGSVFALDHYETYWIPFLDEAIPYVGEKDPPWYHEEPVGPDDAARWSAMTYYHQYIGRVVDAMSRKEIFDRDTKQSIAIDKLIVVIPNTPGDAAPTARAAFTEKHGLREGYAGSADRRSITHNGKGTAYDVPSTLNSLCFLDNRTDAELADAVPEFQKLLENLVNGAKSGCKGRVIIKKVSEV